MQFTIPKDKKIIISACAFIGALVVIFIVVRLRASMNTMIPTPPSNLTTGFNAAANKVPNVGARELASSFIAKLPYRGNGFIITFDYKLNKFLVSPAASGDTQYKTKFLAWLKTSEFASLPLNFFAFK